MKGKGKYIFEKLTDIGAEITSNTVVEIHIGTVCYVSGCNSITSYEDDCIKMNCGDVELSFEGNGLSLENLINGQLSVCGKIKKVEFMYD